MTATSLGPNGAHLDAESCCIARALIRLGCAALAAQGQRRPPGTAGLLAALDPAADLAYDVTFVTDEAAADVIGGLLDRPATPG